MATGCYQPQYLPASFKGVPFEALDVSSTHGRRGAEGEFPFGENTAYADLGRRIRTYSVRGRFVENTHIGDASALIAVCESVGPGLLVHPTRGPVTVACKSCKVSDNPAEERGVTYVDLDFVEANEWIGGLSIGQSIFGFAVGGILSALSASVSQNYTPRSVSFNRSEQVRLTASEAAGQIRDQYAATVGNDGDLSQWRALADLSEYANDPASFNDAEKLFEVFSDGMARIDRDGDAGRYERFRSIVNWAAQSSDLAGSAGQSENAVFGLVRSLGATYMARAAMETEPETLGEGLSQFDAVSAVFEQEAQAALDACDNNLFLEIREFASTVNKSLLSRAYNLPALVTYNFNGSVHSLVAAHEIFGDGRRFMEIERRSPSSWPFMVGPEVVALRQ